MRVYKTTKTVTKDDLDDLNHVNNVRYVQWVQDIAKAHWLDYASNSIRNQNFWVLMSHHIDYKGAALLGDVIQLSTYVESHKGATCKRIVEMHLNEKCIVKSETKWCLLSTSTKRPTRILPEIVELFD